MSGFAALVLGAACGDDDPEVQADAGVDATPPPPDAALAPIFRNPVDLADAELARQALKLLGASEVGGIENCNECHSLTGPRMRDWSALARTSIDSCLTDLDVKTPESARTMLNCLRLDPNDATTPFVTPKLGPLSAAAQLPWFEFVFKQAYGADYAAPYADFKMRVGMPQGGHTAFTQAEFDIVAEWFLRNVPQVDDVITDEPPIEGCTENISQAMIDHIHAMQQSGWGAVDKEAGMLMYGCGDATDPRDCLADKPNAADAEVSATWSALPGQTLRSLFKTGYHSAYWTRSSPDGRFVGHGVHSNSFHAAMIDLSMAKVITLSALYDPGFFPDGSGWMFQTGNEGYLCEQSVLSASPNTIRFDEPGCTTTNAVGLYQYIGTALGGGDYWTVAGNFNSDDGAQSHATFREPPADFRSDESVGLTPFVHTGTSFVAAPTIEITTPYEGDWSMTPSSQVIISRLAGPGGEQAAFVARQLVATPNGMGGYSAEIPEIARYCLRGAKPAFSFDERWMIMHHYVDDEAAVNLGYTGADDPAFQPFRSQGASNVFLVDMLTGARTRITTMKPGQYALYPHFRADGWIYFIVRTISGPDIAKEYVVASDAALVLEANETP